MRVFENITELQEAIRAFRGKGSPDRSATIGFVPTMGYLHAGHESLLQKARISDDLVVLSIFVNPLQFGPNEDFERYPRDPAKDLQLAELAGVDIVFTPSIQEMYPQYPIATKVTVGHVASKLCGATRPGHFEGVATVVCKLFNIVKPDHAYFGLKDVQQVAVIKEMVRDLNMSVQIIPCSTIREPDGLALSSRNVYLSPQERSQAVVLSQTLNKANDWLRQPSLTTEQLEDRLSLEIHQVSMAHIEYASILSYPSLQPLEAGVPIRESLLSVGSQQVVIALAVKFGRTRLIDNRIINLEVVSYV
jgi:pantoate--beta-alanine ligase